jgi:hypothetical protein
LISGGDSLKGHRVGLASSSLLTGAMLARFVKSKGKALVPGTFAYEMHEYLNSMAQVQTNTLCYCVFVVLRVLVMVPPLYVRTHMHQGGIALLGAGSAAYHGTKYLEWAETA